MNFLDNKLVQLYIQYIYTQNHYIFITLFYYFLLTSKPGNFFFSGYVKFLLGSSHCPVPALSVNSSRVGGQVFKALLSVRRGIYLGESM